jgi:hypothetical protein
MNQGRPHGRKNKETTAMKGQEPMPSQAARADEQAGRDWWNALPEDLRSLWPTTPAEAWAEHKIRNLGEIEPRHRCHGSAGECRSPEGKLHTRGCDMERCSECGGQYLYCGCADAMPEDIIGTDRDKRRRVPFIRWPHHCGRCGVEWPVFFNVPGAVWCHYIELGRRDEIVCLDCWEEISTLIDGRAYERQNGIAILLSEIREDAPPGSEARQRWAAWHDPLLPTSATRLNLIGQIEDAKLRIETTIAQLLALRAMIAAYAQDSDLEHQYHDDTTELADDDLDDDGREIDTSPNGVANQMVIDAYNVSAKLATLKVAIATNWQHPWRCTGPSNTRTLARGCRLAAGPRR